MILLYRSSDSAKFVIKADEEADVWVYTRAIGGAQFTIQDESKKDLVPPTNVKHNGSTSEAIGPSTKVQLTATGKIQGPCVLKVKGTSGSMFSSTEIYLVTCSVSPKA